MTRVHIHEAPRGLTIAIHPRRSLPRGLLLGVFLLAWLAVTSESGVWSARSLELRPGDLIVAALACLWLLLGLNASYALLYQLFGAETVALNAHSIRLSRGIHGLGYSEEFPRGEVTRLRDLTRETPAYAHGIALGRSRNGLVGFDHRGRVVRFGDELEPADIGRILDALDRSFPRGTLTASTPPFRTSN